MRWGAWVGGLVALALGMLSFLAPAKAQITVLSGGCGTATITQSLGYYTMNSSGQLCTTGGGGGGGLSVTDQASWTAGTSQMTPVGCVNTPTTSTLAGGTQGTVRCNNQRAQIVDVDTSGNNLYTALIAATPAGANLIGNVGDIYPAGSTAITASATGTTAATTATLAANVSLHTYICGFSIRANATAAITNNATVTGPVTGTLNFTQWTAPLASGLGVTEEVFSPCIISSAINTGIAVISGAPGSGGTVSVTAWGYQL